MVKIEEKDINPNFIQILMGKMTKYQLSRDKNLPTHYTLTKGENGFDKVKYYKYEPQVEDNPYGTCGICQGDASICDGC